MYLGWLPNDEGLFQTIFCHLHGPNIPIDLPSTLVIAHVTLIPIGSMYGIYANIWGILMVNVTIYSIHGSYGIYNIKSCCPFIYQLYPQRLGWALKVSGSPGLVLQLRDCRTAGSLDLRAVFRFTGPSHGHFFTKFMNQYILVGGLEHEFYDFPYIGNNNPNWRTPWFFKGVGSTTNQSCIRYTTNQY